MKKILLVEDDLKLHAIYKEALSPHNISLTAVTTGKEGLTHVMHELPDLAILDVMLPGGMNGFDVARELRQNPKTAQIPIIILTNLDSEKESADAVGAQYIIKSNTSLDEIVRMVNDQLHKDQHLDTHQPEVEE